MPPPPAALASAAALTALATRRLALDTEAGTATLAIAHPGGWSPLPGFVTPAFTGSVAFGVGGTRLALYALAQWGEPTAVVPELLRFVGHPSSGSAGASVQVNLSQATNESDAVYEVRFEGGLELGSGTGAPPVLGVRGVVRSGGEASLQLETVEQWSPLGGDLLALPAMQGNLTVSGGLVSVAAAADHVDIVPDLLALSDLRVLATLALAASNSSLDRRGHRPLPSPPPALATAAAHAHTHAPAHARTHAHAHARTHARTHAHVRTPTYARSRTHARTRMHARTLTHARMQAHGALRHGRLARPRRLPLLARLAQPPPPALTFARPCHRRRRPQ